MRMAKASNDLFKFRAKQFDALAAMVTAGRVVPKRVDVQEGGGKMVVELEAWGEGKERDEAEVALHGIVEGIEEAARLDGEAMRLEERLSALVGGG